MKARATHWPPRGPARVLVVLDRPVILELIKMTLNHGVYVIRAASTASEVATALADWQPHLAMVDMDLDGAQIIGLLQAKPVGGIRLPTIALTRRGDLKTKLAAFEAGVDDILTVPFAPEELLARVIALVRRAYRDAVTFTPVIKLGELEIDILNRTVRAGSSQLHLTSLEQSLLYLLAANAGRVVTREEILDTLWGVDYVAESNVVDRQIRQPASAPAERLAASAVHRHGARPRLSVPAHVQREWNGGPNVLTRTDRASDQPSRAAPTRRSESRPPSGQVGWSAWRPPAIRTRECAVPAARQH